MRSKMLKITDRATGKSRTIPMTGRDYHTCLANIARANGIPRAVAAWGLLARRLISGEAMVTPGYHYEVVDD